MDVLLDRLWGLANEDDGPHRSERVAEARALWRALEVLLTSLKPQELTVGEGIFTKALACIRSVLSDPSYWVAMPSASDTSDDSFVTVFVCVNRVLLKIASRGEQERSALVRDGVADLIVRCVQLRASQFLHQMALEEECKERIGRLGGLQAVTSALSRFAEESEIVVTALDLLFLLCVELECHDGPVQYLPYRSAKATVFHGVVAAVVDAMRALQSVELVQASGVAVLNSMVNHSPVKQALCSLNIWDIAENGLSMTATDKAACDFVELLDTLLRDPVIFEMMRRKMSGNVPDPQDQGISKARIDYNGYGQFVFSSANPTVSSHASTYSDDSSGDELPVDSAGVMGYLNDLGEDDTTGSLLGEGAGYFNKFHQQAQNYSTNTSTGRIGSLPMTVAELDSTNRLEILSSTREVQRAQHSFHELNERYRTVLRRSKEQSKLLALQNVRNKNYGNEHQQILRRMRTLEISLDEADRRCQVERALRSAEAQQYEQLSLALNDSVREAKSLAAQQSSSIEMHQQLKTGRDSSTSRRNSLPSEVLATHLSELTIPKSLSSSTSRSASVYPIHTRTSDINEDLNDDPNSVDTSEIQSCLVSVFESLDTSMEGSSEEGVHVSTVRRFFMESGLVQAPNVLPADVDVVLAGVLAQAKSNRKSSLSRKDFNGAPQESWAPPTGWAKTKKRNSPTKSASFTGNVKRFRFFSQDAFNEAVTLVGVRKFPRFDLLRMLQTVVALYLRPYMRQRQTSFSLATNQLRRSSSTCSISPLHTGHGNENEHLRTRNAEREVRCHPNPPSSMNQSYKREDVVYSMLEMTGILSREQRPLGTICEFYSAQHLPNATAAAAISIVKTELFGLSFELLLNFAIDFELIPSFMDRVSLKRLHTEVAGLLKAYFALHDKDPPTGADAETLKKVAFEMVLARLALELFGTKPGYETPERQITGLLQWLDNSPGREKIMRTPSEEMGVRRKLPLVSRI
ncbi:hypothetical protein JG687_00000931 [Phytophthora cactorum]|uniref:Uncharacterized protein n=1 Tax=Phytophthora cactorum TaxID=29920 RepID=A0A8T1UYQ9_9STRA|nr:hypothetical protein JG687_00000931 [Phytophthora cactorum]